MQILIPAMRLLLLALPAFVFDVSASNAVYINLTAPVAVLEDEFLSVTLDSYSIQKNFRGFDFTSEKVKNMAKALAPADIRVGGTVANYLTFSPTGEALNLLTLESGERFHEFVMSGKLWDTMTTFFKDAGWNLVFDLNQFLRKDGEWDPTNAELFLNYSATKGIEIPYFELGNEPDLYQEYRTISPAQSVEDHRRLHQLLAKFPQYNCSSVVGPSITRPVLHGPAIEYLQDFLDAGGYEVIDEITFHHYYWGGATASMADFLNLSYMNILKLILDNCKKVSQSTGHYRPIRLGETSSIWGGGIKDVSDRFIAGYLWLDKLGVCANYPCTKVFRQAFHGGQYSLLSATLDPTPDFFTSYLYKILVGNAVFSLTMDPPNKTLRVYAQCANKKTYPNGGAVTIYFLNVADAEATIHLDQFSDHDLDLYILSAGDVDGLLSKFIALNGNVLSLVGGTEVPDTPPVSHQGDVTVGPYTYGFIVVPDAGQPECL